MGDVLHWEAQPGPQSLLLRCPVEDVFFGGARGGGKTDGLLGDWLMYATDWGGAARGIIFRKTYPELEEIENRAREIFEPTGATWRAFRRTWEWENGAKLRLRYLQREDDANKYQGHSYSYIGWDELTNWPNQRGVDRLRACLRSAHGAPCLWRATGNPGGPGHNWVKARYIDPAKPNAPFFDAEMETWRVFIPSRLEDNPALMLNDPEYWKRVVAAAHGREDLLKAWRYGIWDIVAGGMFDDLWKPSTHIVEPFEIPDTWRIDRSFDWGSSAPFSVLWWAESDGNPTKDGRVYPKRTLFAIAELYGWNGKPNEGLRLSAAEIARKIVEIEKSMVWRKPLPGPADPSIFSGENGMSIAADMDRIGVRWEKPETTRRIHGWIRMRDLLQASAKRPMEEPGLFVFSTCRQFIRTVPALPRDGANPDDVDTDTEDHIADAARYRIMSRKRELRSVKILGA